MASSCSVNGCESPAVLQWQRAATADESDAAQVAAQHGQERIAAHARTQATLHVVELRAQLDRVVERAGKHDADAARLLPELRHRVTDAEQALTDLPAPRTVDVGAVTVAVFGCDVHKVDDDSATRLHQVGCLDDGCCRCK